MRKVLVFDTSILCVWLRVPGKETCGPNDDRWDRERVDEKIDTEKHAGTLFVLPLASIVETGNHIAQAARFRRERAADLARLMRESADERSPWAAFTDQSGLWTPERLKDLAETWPDLAARKLSLGDTTIKHVAEHYAQAGFKVEILTGDRGLKLHEPVSPAAIPRRRGGGRRSHRPDSST